MLRYFVKLVSYPSGNVTLVFATLGSSSDFAAVGAPGSEAK